MRSIAPFLLPLLLTAFVGCGNSPESVIKKQISLMHEMADVMESDGSQAEVEAELEAIEKRQDALTKELEAMDVSDDEKKRLQEKYEKELTEAMTRMMRAGFARMGKNMGGGK